MLKAAGLTPAKVAASTAVRGYRTVTTQGFSLRHETEYVRKQHVRTGRVTVDLLLSSWHADEAAAARDLAAARAALSAAGFVVFGGVQRQIVVAAVIA